MSTESQSKSFFSEKQREPSHRLTLPHGWEQQENELDSPSSELQFLPRAHLSEKTSPYVSVTSLPASFSSDEDLFKTFSSTEEISTRRKASSGGLWHCLVEAYRKNYCPRTCSPLVLPTAPTEKEKYTYIQMRRRTLVTCSMATVLCLIVGAWMFAKTAPVFAWYAFYILVTQYFLLACLILAVLGKPFDLVAHQKLIKHQHPIDNLDVPSVDIYLPICNEPIELIENTWKFVNKLYYPYSKLKIYVLDDGANDSVRLMASRYGFNYIRRPSRPELKKAGNLRYAFTQTSGDLFTVFDADFCPRSDFLLETVPYMIEDPKRAILQTPQFFRSTSNQTWVEQGAGPVEEYTYRVIYSCRDRWGGAMCSGTNAIYRRAALAPIGGIIPRSSSEDIHTGFYILANGWKLKYLPIVLTCGTCPATPRAYFSQQARWASGIVVPFQKRFWTSSLDVKQKICYIIGGLYYVVLAMFPFLTPLPAPLIVWTKPELFHYYNLLFAIPCLLLDLIVLRLWTRARYTFAAQYVQVIMSYAFAQAIWDLIVGHEMNWVPAGSARPKDKAVRGKDSRYTQMRLVAIAWTLTHNTVLIIACVYRVVVTGMHWYDPIPALAINAYLLLCSHRFLLFRHPRED